MLSVRFVKKLILLASKQDLLAERKNRKAVQAMNYEDIKKELEQHIRIANYVDSIFCDSVSVDLLQKTIDLINRQQAEFERLNGNLFTISNACMQRRNEAIKEFAERLKIDWQENDFYWEDADVYKWIDNLLTEMVGGENA